LATISLLPSGSYRARIRRRGVKNLDKSFKTITEAEAWAKEIEAEQAKGYTAHSKEPGAMSLTEAWHGYQTSITYREKAPSTQKREQSAMLAVKRLIGEYSLTSLTEAIIQRDFIDKRTREKRKDDYIQGDTVRIELVLVTSILIWAKRRGHISEVVSKKADFERPKLGKRDQRISREQEQQLRSAARIYNAMRAGEDLDAKKLPNFSPSAWLDFCLATGTRPGEAAKIELAWIKYENTEIHMRHKPGTKRVIIVTPGSLEKQIERARAAKSKFLFYSISREGKPTYFKYSGTFTKIRTLAGLPKTIIPHIMRHEYISRLFETSGFSDGQIASLVGDEDVASLKPYMHLRTSELRGKLEEHQKAEQIKLKAMLDNIEAKNREEQKERENGNLS